MRLYFYTTKEALGKRLMPKLKDTLKRKGVIVVGNGGGAAVFTPEELAQTQARGEILLDKFQMIVIEGSEYDSQVAYLIAFALAHRKPILVLLPKGTTMDHHLRVLQYDKTVGRWLRVDFYNEKNINTLVGEFVEGWMMGLGKELPIIKFTLRLTPTLDRYLAWKGMQIKKTKADFLRRLVEDLAKHDQRFQVKLKKEMEKY